MSPPFLAHEPELLLAAAIQLLTDRETHYPRLVAAGKMDQVDADAGLRIMRAIVADWQRIVDLDAGRPAAARSVEAGRAEKLWQLENAARNTGAKLAHAQRAARDALPAEIVTAIERDGMRRRDVENYYRARRQGHQELGLLFAAEQRHWSVQALLWNAQQEVSAMTIAEWNREQRDARRPAEAA